MTDLIPDKIPATAEELVLWICVILVLFVLRIVLQEKKINRDERERNAQREVECQKANARQNEKIATLYEKINENSEARIREAEQRAHMLADLANTANIAAIDTAGAIAHFKEIAVKNGELVKRICEKMGVEHKQGETSQILADGRSSTPRHGIELSHAETEALERK